MNRQRVGVRIFYPADPAGIVAGGVDTFIRGILKWAPDDLDFSLVGVTTDASARPRGRWRRCETGRRDYEFLPVLEIDGGGGKTHLPMTVRYTAALVARLGELRAGFDVFDFHRVEPALPFLHDPRPKNAFFHQDMSVIKTQKKADIRWRHMPGLYFRVERFVVGGLSTVWCVREEGVRAMQARFPAKANLIRFVPTWVDTEVFSAAGESDRWQLRLRLASTLDIAHTSVWIVSVGRLDTQKDPELMLNAFAALVAQGLDIAWLVIGDGVLRQVLERLVDQRGLRSRVRFLGLQSTREIASMLRASDVYALSSAYEGMPMALLEALGSGLPVATTDVGEIRKVVTPGVNGAIAADNELESFVACLSDVLAHRQEYRGEPATGAIQAYRPQVVLAPVYENYRNLGWRRWKEGS